MIEHLGWGGRCGGRPRWRRGQKCYPSETAGLLACDPSSHNYSQPVLTIG